MSRLPEIAVLTVALLLLGIAIWLIALTPGMPLLLLTTACLGTLALLAATPTRSAATSTRQ